jgi:hypothetical protein
LLACFLNEAPQEDSLWIMNVNQDFHHVISSDVYMIVAGGLYASSSHIFDMNFVSVYSMMVFGYESSKLYLNILYERACLLLFSSSSCIPPYHVYNASL